MTACNNVNNLTHVYLMRRLSRLNVVRGYDFVLSSTRSSFSIRLNYTLFDFIFTVFAIPSTWSKRQFCQRSFQGHTWNRMLLLFMRLWLHFSSKMLNRIFAGKSSAIPRILFPDFWFFGRRRSIVRIHLK